MLVMTTSYVIVNIRLLVVVNRRQLQAWSPLAAYVCVCVGMKVVVKFLKVFLGRQWFHAVVVSLQTTTVLLCLW